MSTNINDLNYSIFDPTGNITALVGTPVAVVDQPGTAAEIMKQHPEVEQVGFVSLFYEPGYAMQAVLRMAGGEFCGNATMCTAALYMLRRDLHGSAEVSVSVSGASEPLTVNLVRKDDISFDSSVLMPPALDIEETAFVCETDNGTLSGTLPVVHMEGIDHIVIEEGSPFSELKDQPDHAGRVIRKWCAGLKSDCLGMMFLEGEGNVRKLTPLVYVPGADTVFWENSCASGSAATGMYLASRSGEPIDCTLNEPAGDLRVESDAQNGGIRLSGRVILKLTHAADKC